jgi:hypothetical protein
VITTQVDFLGELCGLFFPTFAVKRLFLPSLRQEQKILTAKVREERAAKIAKNSKLGHYRSAHGLAFSLKSSHDGGSYFDHRCADKSMRTSDDS